MSHSGNDEIIDNERDNINTEERSVKIMTRQKNVYNNMSYYETIKQFEYLLESENYHNQVISFITAHFEKHLTEELLQELKDSLRL
jgi:hypothetical protein